MKEIIKILQNYKLAKKEFFVALLTRMFLAGILLYVPILIRNIYKVLEKAWAVEELYIAIWILAAVSLGIVVIILFANIYEAKLWLRVYKRKSLIYRENILDKNSKEILNVWTWKILTRIESGVFAETDIFTRLLQIISGVLFRWTIIIIVVSSFMIEFLYFTIVAIVFLVLCVYLLKPYIKRNNKIEQENWEEDGRNRVRIIMEQLAINLYWKQKYELTKNKKNLDWAEKYWLRADIANEAFYKLVEFIIRFLEIGTFIVIGTIILQWGEYWIADLVMFSGFILLLWEPLDTAISHINTINRNWEKYKKLRNFIDIPNTIINWSSKYIYKTGLIEFKNIDFNYTPERKIFENLNLELLAWKKNALIWHSGWGKSTVTKLILRLYDIKKWEILLDGQEIKSLDIQTFYDKIWYLPQEPAIFDGTIRENMEYAFSETEVGNADLCSTEDRESLIWKALEKAQIDDLIKNLEKWLDTEVWEKWIKLSGWEKQRLAIARIFLKNPEIIILDEPTSALDSISEAKITQSLEELIKWKTSIVIAHRLQTVMNADKIIVIENGKIEAEGKHKELLKNSEVYKNLVDLQNGKIVE